MARFARLSLALALFVPACVTSHSEPSTLEVEASISSATLADDCPAEPAPGLIAEDCAEGTDCGFCRQTTVYLELDAVDGTGEVPFEVLEIRLVSLETGAVVDTLTPSAPEVFDEDVYGAWDERITTGDSLDVRYPTSAPDWATIGGGDSWRTHGMQFRIEMRVRIDGIERTLELAPVSREAEIVT